MQLKPRNSLVVLKLIQESEKKVGAITVMTNGEATCEAIVMAVGPGSVSAQGGISETADLRKGQRVLVNHKAPKQGKMGISMEISGMVYEEAGETYHVYLQQNIFLILAEPTVVDSQTMN